MSCCPPRQWRWLCVMLLFMGWFHTDPKIILNAAGSVRQVATRPVEFPKLISSPFPAVFDDNPFWLYIR